MIGIIRKIFWVALFIVFTLCWQTLFEHGYKDFGTNIKTEIEWFKSLRTAKLEKAKDGKYDR